MAEEDKRPDQYRDAKDRAGRHRQKAGELFAAHAREQDADKKATLLADAKRENEKADGFEQKAEKLLNRFGTSREGEVEAAQKDMYTGRRSWVLPGTVSGDFLQQVEETNQGTLLGNALKYAARSLVERDGAAYNWTKDRAKAVLRQFGRSPDKETAQDKTREKPKGLERA